MLSTYQKMFAPVGIVAIAVLIAVGFYISRPEPKKAEIDIVLKPVKAAAVAKQSVQISVNAQGTVTPRTATTLVSEVTGKIIDVSDNFKTGSFFKKDDVLLRIDDRNYQANLKRAKAAVASAKSNLATEQGRAEVAYQDWIKYRSSVKRSESATALALRKPQLADAQAKLDSANADLDHARDELERTIIRAPYDGLFRQKHVDIGQYVNTGTRLAETFAVDIAELRLAIPENKLSYLELPTITKNSSSKQPHVQLQAMMGDEVYEWQAKLVRTEGVFDDRSRVLFTVAEISDPYGLNHPTPQALRIGTFVDANIEGRTFDDVVVLPRSILRPGNNIWVIDQQQRLQNRQVSILRTGGNEMYVTKGLNNGELVCLTNISGAIPGTEVIISSTVRTDQQSLSPVPEIKEPQRDNLNIAPAAPEKNNENLKDKDLSA